MDQYLLNRAHDEVRLVKEAYGWDPDRSFYVPDEAREIFGAAVERGKEFVAEWESRTDRYAKDHPDLAPTVESYGVQFLHLPINASVRLDSEAQLLALVAERDIDLVVLARYMQILPGSLTMALPGRVINIHHSFLPGFKGARPYHQAWERGVKIIGATAHFVTEELDEGPIIDQDVSRVGHAQSAEQMAVIGKDIERLVLSRAVKAWAEGRVFLLGDRTVVFP